MSRKRKHTKKQKNSGINKSGIEQRVEGVLKQFGVNYKHNAAVDKYTVDFLVEGDYIIECYGDFWHCNPTKYSSTFFNRGVKKSAEQIWERDKKRKECLESLGYKFLCLWESEINSSIKAITSKIKKFIR